MKKISILLSAILALTGCYQAEFYAPSKVDVSLDIAIPTDSDGAAITDPITVLIDGVEYEMNEDGSFDVGLLEIGTYTYYVYNNPAGESGDDSKSTIKYDSTTGSIIASVPTVDEQGNIATNTDQLYYGENTIEVSSDATTFTEGSMESIIGDLEFKLLLSGDAVSRLSGVTAQLNGVAQHWDCINNTFYGSSASVLPTLTVVSSPVSKSSDDVEYSLEGLISLLGIVTSDKQIFTLELEYEDSHPTTHTLESDITAELAKFNDDKSTITVLTNTVETPTEMSPNGTIGNWNTTIYDVEAK